MFDLLKEWVKFAFTVIKLGPEGVGEHVGVRVVDVAAFILSVVPRCAFVRWIGMHGMLKPAASGSGGAANQTARRHEIIMSLP